MRSMLMIYRDEKEWEGMSVQERGVVYQAAVDYSEARRPSGFYQGGEPLEPTRTATTVRIKGDKALMTDGPFAETKEQLAGYTILEARELDEARAFLVPAPTMAQRLVRAKAKVRTARIPYQVPVDHALSERLDAVMVVVYLVFNEGYAASFGERLVRHELCEQAIRLGRHRAAGRPGSDSLEPRADRGGRRAGRSRAPRRGAAAGRILAAGGHRRSARSGTHRRRDRLGADCRAVRCPGACASVADRRAQSGDRGRHVERH